MAYEVETLPVFRARITNLPIESPPPDALATRLLHLRYGKDYFVCYIHRKTVFRISLPSLKFSRLKRTSLNGQQNFYLRPTTSRPILYQFLANNQCVRRKPCFGGVFQFSNFIRIRQNLSSSSQVFVSSLF